MIKNPSYIIVFALFFLTAASSCTYQKLLKSNDSELKYTKAKEYYENREYAKAMAIFEQLTPVFRGDIKGEEVGYLFAYCNYYTRDYIMAGHYFRRFNSQYQNSKYAEETSYMSAYCYYLDAPKPSLDQETTNKAISEFQLYMAKYPLSERIPQCNELVDELRLRLEQKSYDNAYQYYRTGRYKSAVVAFRGSLKEFPDSEFREEIMYYTIKSNYLYAVGSVYGKTTERLKDALKDYKSFIKTYPNSKYLKDITKIHGDINRKLTSLN